VCTARADQRFAVFSVFLVKADEAYADYAVSRWLQR
jgi:hypothetical protein